MVTDSLRSFANGNKSVMGLFDPFQTTLNEFTQMPKVTCNNDMCTEESNQKEYCSKKCRIEQTSLNYYERRT